MVQCSSMSQVVYKYSFFLGTAGFCQAFSRHISFQPQAVTSKLTSAGVSCRALSHDVASSVNYLPPTLTSKVGISFTPGGLLFPYHLGVAKCLAKNGLLATDTSLAGASAGALAAAVVGCGLDINMAKKLAGSVFKECRNGGPAFRLKDIVARGLDNALPENAHDILNKREGRVTIGVTELFPRPKGIFVSEFSSKEDLIEVLLGSCHVPFWFSGSPYMYVRGKPTVDGFFATPVKHFGAPGIPSADEIIRVTVFPTTSIEVHAEQPGGVISPDLLDRYSSGRFLELLNYALNPGNEVLTEELFNAGFESGSVWCERYGDACRKRHEERHGSSEVAKPFPSLNNIEP